MPRRKNGQGDSSSKTSDLSVESNGRLPVKRPRGAGGHLTPAQVTDLKKYLLGVFTGDKYLSLEAIAHKWGISRWGLWKRVKEDPELAEAWYEYVEFKIDMARTTLMGMATGDIPTDKDRLRAIGLFLARYDIHVIRSSSRPSPDDTLTTETISVQIVTAEPVE